MTVTEAELKAAAVAPQVTLEDVQDFIVKEEFIYHGCLTLCVLTLKNGFTVTGESACADPANYVRLTGEKNSKGQAFNKIWPLLGFQLKNKLDAIQAAGKPSGKILTLGSPRSAIGSKVVHYVAMDRQAYVDLRGWDLPSDEDGEDLGYLVQYTDGGAPNVPGFTGYVSWSPRGVFEKAYDVAIRQQPETFMDRLILEFGELGTKATKLQEFMSGPVFQTIPEEEQRDMSAQLTYMLQYLNVLSRRIARLG